ncbi:MAG: chitobiase/beta-hexosaminidase C-terminal domain-containing protein [Patescibacteria group bacterium]|nr:chitobiase/beta-hexosaminidase C-terminal domain-containing protein [Patescibacteria group bacterium]
MSMPAFASTVGGTLSGGTVITAPSASPSAGEYGSAQSVELSASGASEIRYTTDGSVPSCGEGADGDVYSSAIDVSSSLTIKAISCYYEDEEGSSEVVSFTYTINIPALEPETQSGGGGGGNGPPVGFFGVGGSGQVLGASITPQGEVLGAYTSTEPQTQSGTTTPATSATPAPACEPLITHYLHAGWANDADEVKALQQFLAGELGIELPVTGIYDAATIDAVNAFQLKYWEDVLAPWVPHGLATDHTPTGYVYKTTSWKINQLHCGSLATPFPELP